jgi:copper resistance protein B
MKGRLLHALLRAAVLLPGLTLAQPPADPHAGHVMPAAPAPADAHAAHAMPAPTAVDHSQHAMPAATAADPHAGPVIPTPAAVDHSQHVMPAATTGALPPGTRDPHAYANGHAVGSGAFALPGGHAAHMQSHVNNAAIVLDRLETADTDAGRRNHLAIDAWYGQDFARWWLLSDVEQEEGEQVQASTELLASRAISSYWDVVGGVQLDTGDATRSWLSTGLRGLAPYWFEVDARLLLGESGQSALQLEAEYELRLTQKLVLQPVAELAWHGRTLRAQGEGKGLAETRLGLRLRHEFTPQFAPYLGVEQRRDFGTTAELTRAAGLSTRDTQVVFGLRLWF